MPGVVSEQNSAIGCEDSNGRIEGRESMKKAVADGDRFGFAMVNGEKKKIDKREREGK